MLKVSVEAGLNPGSTARSFWKLRTMSPEATSRTSASATCAPMRNCRARWLPRVGDWPRPFSCSVGATGARRRTGITPNTAVATMVRPIVKATVTMSSRTSSRRGRLAGPKRHEQLNARPGQHEAERAADQRQQCALGEEVARDRATAGAKCATYRNLTLPESRSGRGTSWRRLRTRPARRGRPQPSASRALAQFVRPAIPAAGWLSRSARAGWARRATGPR